MIYIKKVEKRWKAVIARLQDEMNNAQEGK